MREPLSPFDIDERLADAACYESVILRLFEKRRQRGQAFGEADEGVTFFDTAAKRRSLSAAIARSVAAGEYEPEPVDLWLLETKGKQRAAHMPAFADHVVGSALFQLLSHNARCYGLPGVYSYLPGMTNATAMRALAAFVRAHRDRTGPHGPPMYVLQSDFDHYGDGLPVGPDAPLWPVLREVAGLGSAGGEVSATAWGIITTLVRPVVRDQQGGLFTRRHGVPMGTPLVPILSNLAVAPMDRAILGIEGVFYARYNDDFLVAHPDLAAIQRADAVIDTAIADLGVRRKSAKELRSALSPTGMPSLDDPAYRGSTRIDCLGLSVGPTGALAIGPHRIGRFVRRVAARVDNAARAVKSLPVPERTRHLVAATNVMLDVTNPFAVPGLPALMDTTTDRGVLRDIDFRIARKIVQAATGLPGVRGFRVMPPGMLYREMGLASVVRLRNLR